MRFNAAVRGRPISQFINILILCIINHGLGQINYVYRLEQCPLQFSMGIGVQFPTNEAKNTFFHVKIMVSNAIPLLFGNYDAHIMYIIYIFKKY